jgi:2-polyprenyl-6-methoxyphenol hydroxylase-like FAD-dependent oxidoreductase
VAGAGIGGLAAALALRQAGWNVTVIEQAATPRELGFALLLAPNAMHAIRQLGLADAVRAGGAIVQSGEIRRPDGHVLRRLDAAAVARALGEDAVCVLRPVLHGALLDAVGPDALRLSHAVTSVRQEGESVVVEGQAGPLGTASLVVGADGVGSVVRRQLHRDEQPPMPSGLFAVRGVAWDVVAHLEGVSGAQYLGRGIEAGVARASERAVYWYLSLRGDHIARLGGSSDLTGLLSRVVEPFHVPFRNIVAATRPEDLRFDPLLTRPTLPSWGTGSVTLLGDAAHPMLPHAGQGAAQALEDAVALGRAARPGAGLPESLRRYERIRQRRTAAVVALARRNARVGSIDNALGCALRDLAISLVPAAFILKSQIAMARAPAD